MKKTVRIRKAKPGETPGYKNKTKQFLQKAQTGMSINNSGQQQQKLEQMYRKAYSSLLNDTPADIVYYSLINDFGANGETANMILQSAFQQLVQEGYINPNEDKESQEQPGQPEQPVNPNQGQESIEGQEEQDLIMSQEDNSHIDNYATENNFDEQQMQQEAFQYGGYNEGGSTNQDPILDQYDTAGQNTKPNFSLDELIQQQAGVQLFNPQGSQIGDYIGNYGMNTNWQNQNWLPAQNNSIPPLEKAKGGKGIGKWKNPFKKGKGSKGRGSNSNVGNKESGSMLGVDKDILRLANMGLMGNLDNLARIVAPVMVNPLRATVLGAPVNDLGPFTGSPLNINLDKIGFPNYGGGITLPSEKNYSEFFTQYEKPGAAPFFKNLGNSLDPIKLEKEIQGNKLHELLYGTGLKEGMRGWKDHSDHGVFTGVLNPNNPNSNIHGAKIDPESGFSGPFSIYEPHKTGISMHDPGLEQIYRRLPFSEKHIPINMDKFRNDQFDWAQQGGYFQSLIERYGYMTAYAMMLSFLGFDTPQETVDEYINEPLKDFFSGDGEEAPGYSRGVRDPAGSSSYKEIKNALEKNKKGGSIKLPKAKGGVSMPSVPPIVSPKPPRLPNPYKFRGYDWMNKIAPMQNTSAIGRMAPIFSAMGYGLHKTPGLNWLTGMKKGPQQDSYITQNIYELARVLQGESPSSGVFSKSIAKPGELQVDRIAFATEDLNKILAEASIKGKSSFHLGDLIPSGQGTIAGIYPAQSKISTGQDESGNNFFDISYTYQAGDVNGVINVPSNAQNTSFRNRFYFTPGGESGFNVFDGTGEPLTSGVNNLFKVTRPLIPSLYRGITRGFANQANNTLGSSGLMGLRTGPGIQTSGPLKSLFSREEITSLPPNAWSDLSTGKSIGRGLEQLGYQYGTFPFGLISSAFGYNPIRTRSKNIIDISEPASIYQNKSKPGLGTPLQDVNTAEDILNNTNYFRRKGFNLAAILAGGTYLGNEIYDAFMDEGEAPLGDIRQLLPRNTNKYPLIEEYNMSLPDSLKNNDLPFLNEQNYYRNQNNYEMPDWDTIPENYKEGGKISKKKFTKNLLAFYEDGGENDTSIGNGNRMDTATKDVQKIKTGFIDNLKTGSNKAMTNEIYDLAKNSPEIMQTLMQNGKQENLSQDSQNNNDDVSIKAQWGMNMQNTPSWYKGYMNNMKTPREYRQLFRQLRKMMPRNGTNIRRANYASAIGGSPFTSVLSNPGYMSMFNDYAMGNMNPFMLGMYGVGNYNQGYRMPQEEISSWTSRVPSGARTTSQSQAEEVEAINNAKSLIHTLKNNNNTNSNDMDEYKNFFNAMKMQQGGFVNMESENPLSRFIYGGNENEYYEPYDMPIANNGITVMNEKGENVGMPSMLSYADWQAEELASDPSADISNTAYDSYRDFYSGALQDNIGGRGSASSSQGNQNNQNNQNNGSQGCPPGYMFSSSSGRCVPMMQFRPNYRRGPASSGGLFRNLTPWNKLIGRGGNWTKQLTTPYMKNSGDPYLNSLGKPVSVDVTKTNWRGKPKKYTLNYDPYNTGVTNSQNQSNNRSGDKSNKQSRVSRREEDVQNFLNSDPTWDRKHWDQASRRQQRMELQDYRFDQKDYNMGHRLSPNYEIENTRERPRIEGFKNKVRGAGQKILNKINPFKEFGGELPEARFGEAFDANTGFGVGVGDKTSAYNQFSPQTQFENQYSGGYDPNKGMFKSNSNPFSFITPTATGSYAETKNTGVTLDQQGQNVVPQDPCTNATEEDRKNPNSECYDPGLVSVDMKNKSFWNIDPEAGVNVKNAALRTGIGMIGRGQMGAQNRAFLKNTTSTENNAANTTNRIAGNWGATTGQGHGMFRYDQEGQNASGMASDVTSRYGGYLQEGGFANVPYYDEGEQTYMTQPELDAYLAAGGQVEYLY